MDESLEESEQFPNNVNPGYYWKLATNVAQDVLRVTAPIDDVLDDVIADQERMFPFGFYQLDRYLNVAARRALGELVGTAADLEGGHAEHALRCFSTFLTWEELRSSHIIHLPEVGTGNINIKSFDSETVFGNGRIDDLAIKLRKGTSVEAWYGFESLSVRFNNAVLAPSLLRLLSSHIYLNHIDEIIFYEFKLMDYETARKTGKAAAHQKQLAVYFHTVKKQVASFIEKPLQPVLSRDLMESAVFPWDKVNAYVIYFGEKKIDIVPIDSLLRDDDYLDLLVGGV